MARIHGLNRTQAGEMVKAARGVEGMDLNLESILLLWGELAGENSSAVCWYTGCLCPLQDGVGGQVPGGILASHRHAHHFLQD